MRGQNEYEEEYRELVRDVYDNHIREVNSHYPNRQSVRFDWQDINAFNEDVAEQILTNPKKGRKALENAVKEWDEVDIPEAVIRVHNIPEDYHFRVGKQRSLHLGNLITIEGEVVEMAGVKPFAREAALQCMDCGHTHHRRQSYGKMVEPGVCLGCDNASVDYRLRRHESDLIDYREVTLKRADTNLDDDPPTLTIYLTEDLVDRIGPGDLVSLVGYYDTADLQRKSILETYLDTWDIESQKEGVTADKLSPEELEAMIVEEVEENQDNDTSTFGAERDAVIEAIADRGVRETEVEDRLDELVDESELSELGGGRLMVT